MHITIRCTVGFVEITPTILELRVPCHGTSDNGPYILTPYLDRPWQINEESGTNETPDTNRLKFLMGAISYAAMGLILVSLVNHALQ